MRLIHLGKKFPLKWVCFTEYILDILSKMLILIVECYQWCCRVFFLLIYTELVELFVILWIAIDLEIFWQHFSCRHRAVAIRRSDWLRYVGLLSLDWAKVLEFGLFWLGSYEWFISMELESPPLIEGVNLLVVSDWSFFV
jgi:hypothetical protein